MSERATAGLLCEMSGTRQRVGIQGELLCMCSCVRGTPRFKSICLSLMLVHKAAHRGLDAMMAREGAHGWRSNCTALLVAGVLRNHGR